MKFLLYLLTLVVACAEGPAERQNEAPLASLILPERFVLGQAAPFDASSSFDPDGALAELRMSFGDGSAELSRRDGHFEHAFTSAGAFSLRLVVGDEDGATDEVFADIVIVQAIDDPPCDCQIGCLQDNGICTAAGCFVARLSERAALSVEAPTIDGQICE